MTPATLSSATTAALAMPSASVPPSATTPTAPATSASFALVPVDHVGSTLSPSHGTPRPSSQLAHPSSLVLSSSSSLAAPGPLDLSVAREIPSWDPTKESLTAWSSNFTLLTTGFPDSSRLALLLRKLNPATKLQAQYVMATLERPTVEGILALLREQIEGPSVRDAKTALMAAFKTQRADESGRQCWARLFETASALSVAPPFSDLVEVFLARLMPFAQEALASKGLSSSNSITSILNVRRV